MMMILVVVDVDAVVGVGDGGRDSSGDDDFVAVVFIRMMGYGQSVIIHQSKK